MKPIAPVVSAMLLFGACANTTGLPACATSDANPLTLLQAGMPADDGYRLASGDRVRVTVFRHPDLSGEFELDGQGTLALPLIGEFSANGMTTPQLKEALERNLREQGYPMAPRVSIDVLAYRPFYILGEVARPGEYEYEHGMVVVEAVALAGGYSYRADAEDITIRRGECSVPAEIGTHVLPGDVVTVPERVLQLAGTKSTRRKPRRGGARSGPAARMRRLSRSDPPCPHRELVAEARIGMPQNSGAAPIRVRRAELDGRS